MFGFERLRNVRRGQILKMRFGALQLVFCCQCRDELLIDLTGDNADLANETRAAGQ